MSTEAVDSCIRNNLLWSKLSPSVRQILGNSQKEYEKMVLDYSIGNQLRFKGNLVRHVRKNEEHYYDQLMQNSRTHLMLYPYHLSDIIVKELRITPFNYYIVMILDLMETEKSYDTLPNFTAADCLRLLGIGRNQYIDLMNRVRSNRRPFRKARSSTRELLPRRPVPIAIKPWWMLCGGSVLEEDVKLCSRSEKDIIDILYDEGPQLVGILDASVVQQLYHKGLAYLTVPIHDGDNIYVPPLDGFVMNRVMGDYFEKLLYKIFVSIDEHSTMKELDEVLDIDLQLIKNAVSVFCRLGFAKKRVTGLENLALHFTWKDHMKFVESDSNSIAISNLKDLSCSLTLPADISIIVDDDELDEDDCCLNMPAASLECLDTQQSSTPNDQPLKRIGFLFDSTLTAFLMMGNLSPNLKSHAVTLFEVGKLSDETLDNFVEELGRVNHFGEGEALRYFEHSQALRFTILQLRNQAELDLIRCESLLGLDPQSRLRVLQKNYQLLVSMAPLTPESSPLSFSSPVHFGPPISEVNSPWFRLYLYNLLRNGPTSMLLPRGWKLRRLPRCFRDYRKLSLCIWAHEPAIVQTDVCLALLNESLQSSAVFLQAYSDISDDSEIVRIPFPFNDDFNSVDDQNSSHSIEFNLNCLCGYVTLLRWKSSQDPLKTDESIKIDSKDSIGTPPNVNVFDYDQWILFDCVFGMPLFDRRLNRAVCTQMLESHMLDLEKRDGVQFANRHLSLSVLNFVDRLQSTLQESIVDEDTHTVRYPTRCLLFDRRTVRICD